MSNIIPYEPKPVIFSPRDLINIRAMCPKDATSQEFDRFISMCQTRGVDPRLGHAYLFLFNAEDPKKRSVVTIVSESGYLAAANRCRGAGGESIFRPDDKTPRLTYDEAAKDPKTNPLGLVSAAVSVFKYLYGEWHEIPAEVFWDERAPLVEKWERNEQTGKREPTGELILDPKKRGWVVQGRTMLAKCARVAAARYAFPDQFGGLYVEEEAGAIERGKLLDLSATEVIEEDLRQEKRKALGADSGIPFDFGDGKGIVYVPFGMVHDRLEAYFIANPSPEGIRNFSIRNRVGLRELHARAPGELLDLKGKYMEPAAEKLKEQEGGETAADNN